MKKVIFILALALGLSACNKEHIVTPQTITYQITGEGVYAEIYSNQLKRSIPYNVTDTGLMVTESVNPGDSVSVFVMSSWIAPSSVKISLGGRIISQGTADSTGLFFVSGTLNASYFLK